MNRKLLSLLIANKGRGSYRAETGESGNVILIYDVIVSSESDAEWWGGVSAESVIRALMGMTGPVTVRINSPGGDVFGGQSIFNALKAYPDKVTVYVDGFAASAASTVALAGDEVIMSGSGAMFMIHNAWTIDMGDRHQFRAAADLLEKIDTSLAAQYAEKTGKSAEEIAAMMDATTWLTAEESVALGLASRVATATAPASNSIAWDVSAYGAKPPKATAEPVAPDLAPAAPEVEPEPESEIEADPPQDAAAAQAHRQRRLALALAL